MVRVIIVIITIVSLGANVWFFSDRISRENAASEALAEHVNGVSAGLRESLNELSREKVDWAIVYSGVLKAETDANAARLMAIQVNGIKRDVAVKLGGFQGYLQYYGAKMALKARGEITNSDEQKINSFAQVLVTVRPFIDNITLQEQRWDEFIQWLDYFESSLVAKRSENGKSLYTYEYSSKLLLNKAQN